MSADNPFSSPNKKMRHSDGVLDIDKIIEEEKIHAHKGAASRSESVNAVAVEDSEPKPKLDAPIERPEIENLSEVHTVPAFEELIDDEPSEDDEYHDDDSKDKSTEEVATWRPPSRRIPRAERVINEEQKSEPTEELETPESPEDVSEPTESITLDPPKNTPNRRNLMLVIGAIILIIALIVLVPKLINSGIIYESNDTGNTTNTSETNDDSTNVTAGLSSDVNIKKVSDGLESDDPDKWEVTFTADTTNITLSVDCTPNPGGGTSPNLSCVSSDTNEVIDGTFVKPFTAGEGWVYEGSDYGYCYSFADKVSVKTVQADLYGSSGIQLFYMAGDFKICSKSAGNPETIPQNTPCDEQVYCPAVRLRSIS